MKLLNGIKRLFTKSPVNYYQWHIEAFVESKKPRSTAEVEFWIRKYEQEQRRNVGVN
jgi:hypothetical protein